LITAGFTPAPGGGVSGKTWEYSCGAFARTPLCEIFTVYIPIGAGVMSTCSTLSRSLSAGTAAFAGFVGSSVQGWWTTPAGSVTRRSRSFTSFLAGGSTTLPASAAPGGSVQQIVTRSVALPGCQNWPRYAFPCARVRSSIVQGRIASFVIIAAAVFALRSPRPKE
jgi:hypothetical protein